MKITSVLFLCLALGLSANLSRAQLITNKPDDAVAHGVAVSNPFGSLAVGGTVGYSLISFGVDYSWGNKEGIFIDPPEAFGGVNGSGRVDLLAGVDGRIVILNTFNQGLTDYVSVMAGDANRGNLLLTVFDVSGKPISAVVNHSNAVSKMTIDLTGNYEIAFFAVTSPGDDTFGVRSVTIDAPRGSVIPSAVPEPSTYGLLGAWALGAVILARRRRQS